MANSQLTQRDVELQRDSTDTMVAFVGSTQKEADEADEEPEEADEGEEEEEEKYE